MRTLYESWPATTSPQNPNQSDAFTPIAQSSFDTDHDPLDQLLEGDELGLIIRTDFTNHEAWDTFSQKVKVAQKELIFELTGNGPGPTIMDASTSKDSTMKEEANDDADEEESDSSLEISDIVKILDPSDEADKIKLTNISNIAALRLFNDVDIRPAPALPAGTKRISPPNPLIDLGGWQEIYTGKDLWIYDAQSNADECVRVVSQAGEFYGTASGDSWRARHSHICELQFNMTHQGLKIDFNGLDKWDWNERVRNIQESQNI